MTRTKKSFTTLLLYLFGFLLLLEWMRPVEELTDTGNIWAFMIFLFLSLSFSYLNVGAFYSFLIKAVYVIFVLQFLYFEGSFFSFEWLPFFIEDMAKNVENLILLQWDQLSDMFRSILFFILLGLMTYLMKYWLVIQRQILVFLVMTLIYITVLDTFTPYNALGAIIRTVVIGFLLLGMLTYLRILDKENVRRQKANLKGWMLPLLLIIGSSTFLAYLMPKSEPNWPDPVPFIESIVTENGVGNEGFGNNTGYGEDDSRLGGPFNGNDEVVYRTKTDSEHYWRIETKDVYTGKGWKSSNEEITISFGQVDVPFSPYDKEFTAMERYSAYVESTVDYTHLIYPAGIKRVLGSDMFSFEADMSLEKIYSLSGQKQVPLRQYEVLYDVPSYNVNDLKKATDNGLWRIDERFMERYTQLPVNLPQRVNDLAQEITARNDTWYDKAKAIENYFENNGFIYEQTNVATPGENEDYVDQFLFETKEGYCDNYSTSMVVLLRATGIPSRWVKGYTEGEFKGMDETGLRSYEITNNHAHSWVEVYFPETGWVPFEPTIGYTGYGEFTTEEPIDNEEEPKEEVQEEERENEEEEEPVNEEEDQGSDASTKEEQGFSMKELKQEAADFLKKVWPIFLYVLGFLALAVLVLYLTRRKWLPRFYISRYKKKNANEDFLTAYPILLKQLEGYGLKRKPDQTLREYARIVDEKFLTDEMGMMTGFYEQYLYKGVLEENTWRRTKNAWEKLIMKTIA